MASFLPLLLIFAVMWAVLIRPQQQRLRRQRALVSSVEVGEEVVTAGGMIGRVVAMDSEQVTLEVPPDGVRLAFLRAAINRNLSAESGPATEPVGGSTDAASEDDRRSDQPDEGAS
jgi:preprotein translocase subunit YajC